MTDTGGETTVDEIVVTGQRRRPGGAFPSGGGGGGYAGPPDGVVRTIEEAGDDPEPPQQTDPCANPDTALDWNTDAAAGDTVKDLKEFSQTQPPVGGRGFNEREYGAALWQLPNGSITRGPMRYSEQTFAEAAAAASQGGIGRPFVAIDWTPPQPGAVPIGSVHTHGPEEHLPSGHMGDLSRGDVGHLFGVMANREFYSGTANGSEARIYIASNDYGAYEVEGPTRIHVYDQRNIASAVGGADGPEVNPEGRPCEDL